MASLKAFLCKHSFETIQIYDLDTMKTYCHKCGNKYVVNTAYKWKFRLNQASEKDYEDLRKNLQSFQEHYSKQKKSD
jgi:hypothetical protein